MKILFLARTTLYKVYGGDTVQIASTAKYLRLKGVEVDIKLSHEKIDYSMYDLMHLFNATRPADLLYHIRKSGLPYVLSPIFVDYSEYNKWNSKGFRALLFRIFKPDQIEYLKVIARWIKNGEKIKSLEYLWKGHRKSVQSLIKKAVMLLPNSNSEYVRLVKEYEIDCQYRVIYNGIDEDQFKKYSLNITNERDKAYILCVARIEGKKNHLNLVKALNNTKFQLWIVGKPAPNHLNYFEECKKIAGPNIHFEGFISEEKLMMHYEHAKVHILPSWNETCGLSSLEAAYSGCNLVITDKGDTVEYFGDSVWYCDPSDPGSIYNAIKEASEAQFSNTFREKIIANFTWEKAADETLKAYKEAI